MCGSYLLLIVEDVWFLMGLNIEKLFKKYIFLNKSLWIKVHSSNYLHWTLPDTIMTVPFQVYGGKNFGASPQSGSPDLGLRPKVDKSF